MKRRGPGKRELKHGLNPDDAQAIDARYGLEPVFDPGESLGDGDGAGELQFRSIACPYCGEHFDAALDPSAGSARYVEDCQICCQPIEFDLEVDHDGGVEGFSARRLD